MILPVSNFNKNTNFTAQKAEKPPKYDKDTLLENNFLTRTRISLDKLGNAFTVHPARGLHGDRQSNFYEFLNMGTVPYIVGSLMLMSVFNSANKHFGASDYAKAFKLGSKMALGVMFYALMKSVAKPLVTYPVKWITGVDVEVPYAKVSYGVPNSVGDSDITNFEYHKAFESKEFPRWDLFYKSEAKGEIRNEYYDKIAKKLGLGTNLKDSDQEVKPLIKNIAIRTDMAKMISSYLWAAAGVCYAFQSPWEEYLKSATLKVWKFDKFKHSIKVLMRSAKDSAIEMWKGPKALQDVKGMKAIGKHAGKMVLGAAVLSTVFGVINSVSIKRPRPEKDVIDRNRKYVVD